MHLFQHLVDVREIRLDTFSFSLATSGFLRSLGSFLADGWCRCLGHSVVVNDFFVSETSTYLREMVPAIIEGDYLDGVNSTGR